MMIRLLQPLFTMLIVLIGCLPAAAQPGSRITQPSTSAAKQSLRLATEFMQKNIAVHGGYAWVSSADGKYSHGEGVAGQQRVWVQPPGTPAVGLAMLRAYQATEDKIHLNAARGVADALILGQLRSGGWGYAIQFDPAARAEIPYRTGPLGSRSQIPPHRAPGGWDVWRKRKFKTNRTLIDDDTTPAAVRFLARLDQQLNFKDARVHEATNYALDALIAAQYPIGAWGHNYDRYQLEPASRTHYPVVKASYPDAWSRTWDGEFDGCYMLNDRITLNMIETMLLCAEIYNDDRYWQSAKRGGQFLLLAQMPDPQPAWAQQYDRLMSPVWDRKFEPPAITGGESQDTLLTLLQLYRATQDKRYLEPVPRALAYLKESLRPDGSIARYYELKTNRPIYFDKKYQLTYDDSSMPDHYGFIRESRLKKIERQYQALLKDSRAQPAASSPKSIRKRAQQAIDAQAQSGGWLEPGFVRNLAGKKVTPPEGIVSSQTYIDHIKALCDLIKMSEE